MSGHGVALSLKGAGATSTERKGNEERYFKTQNRDCLYRCYSAYDYLWHSNGICGSI